MGKTSADIQREIESIRDDLSSTVAELERRVKRTVDWRSQVEQHPAVVGVIGFGVLAGVSLVGYNAVASYRESRKPVNRLRREVGERWEQTREALPVDVSVRRRRSNGEGERVGLSRQEPGMTKKLMWAALTAGVVALFGLLARRVSSAVWEMVMHEPPPTARV